MALARIPLRPADRFFAIDGLTGLVQFEIPDNINNTYSAAVAELRPDSDGPEIVLPRSNTRLQMYAADGTLLWDVAGGRVAPVIANVDSDPEPEIIATDNRLDIHVFDVDGTTAWDTSQDPDTAHPSTLVVADLTDDGIGDVIATTGSRRSVVAFTAPANPGDPGVRLFETTLRGTTFGGPAVADVDGDGRPEIIVGDNAGTINIINDDGSMLKQINFDGANISPPTVADIDSDGRVDIVFSAISPGRIYAITLTPDALADPNLVIEIDDVLLWSQVAQDSTNSGSGIAVYDLDGDGIWEVVWNGFGPDAEQEYGGLSIFSGLDGTLIYNNPRINSRTWDESVSIGDVDGDGKVEIVAGDQEGVWIVGADDLWIGARDIWNQASYHISNINADLTVPENEPESWGDHNTYRTQRPPAGLINRLDLEVVHTVPVDAYDVDGALTTPTPDADTNARIEWRAVRRFNDPDTTRFELTGTVSDLAPGETLAISEMTSVTARYTDDLGIEIEIPIELPPVVVGAPHIIDVEPSERTIDAGASTVFDVILSNLTDVPQNYALSVVGLGDASVQLVSDIDVPAQDEVTTQLAVSVPDTASGVRAFSVEAVTGSGGRDAASATLVINPIEVVVPNDAPPPAPIDLADLSVNVGIAPAQQLIGRGATATYVVTVTNTGDKAALFDMSASLGAGFTVDFDTPSVAVQPGVSNARNVLLSVTAAATTGSAQYPFSVTARAASDAGVSDAANASVEVSPLGVALAFDPGSGPVGRSYDLVVRNTGDSSDTYDLALVGAIASDAELSVSSVTLDAGSETTLSVTVGSASSLLPGTSPLVAVATSTTENAVTGRAQLDIVSTPTRGLSASLAPDLIMLDMPGDWVSGLRVENRGNTEESYRAIIEATSGPLSADFVGLDRVLTQSIAEFRLPPFTQAIIPLTGDMLNYGEGDAVVRVETLLNPLLSADDRLVVETMNLPPVADAGADVNVATGTQVTLDGSGSFDPNGDLIEYAWSLDWSLTSKTAASTLTNADLMGLDTPRPHFVPDVDGEYVLQLVVRDALVDSAADEVRVVAGPSNVPPNAIARADANHAVGASVALDGAASFDPDLGPDPLAFQWTLVDLPLTSALTSDDIVNRDSAQARLVPDVAGEYRVELSVGDGIAQDFAEVVLTARVDQSPPNADAGPDQSEQLGQVVQLDGSASSDPDDAPAPLSFKWRFVSLPLGSTLGNGAIAASDTALPTFEPDVPGQYVLRVDVSDSLMSDADNVLIDVEESVALAPIDDLLARPKAAKVTLTWAPFAEAQNYDLYGNVAGGAYDLIAERFETATGVYLETGADLRRRILLCHSLAECGGSSLGGFERGLRDAERTPSPVVNADAPEPSWFGRISAREHYNRSTVSAWMAGRIRCLIHSDRCVDKRVKFTDPRGS